MRSILMMTVGILVSPTSFASPTLDLPEVSGSEIPFVHFGGKQPLASSTVLTTVPDDKELIVTMVVVESEISVLQGDTVVIPTWVTDGSPPGVSTLQGNAHVPIGPGQTLSVRNESGGERGYFLQGYWAEPGSPYRSFYSPSWPSVEGRTIMTAEDDRPFLVQTIATLPGCDVLIDDVIAIPKRSLAAYNKGGLLGGQGTIVVPAGSRLHVSESCSYFVNGKYLTP